MKIHVLALKAHPKAGPRYLDILQKTMQQFDQRYGPYPYKIITLIDPEPGSEMGGMEYPTLFTGDTSWYDPTHITELTAEHEFGHQYWYGMVATNEFEDAWLDEGINSYTEVKVLDAILGRNTSVFDRPYTNAGDYELQRFDVPPLPRLRSRHPLGLQVPQLRILRRHHLRQIRHPPRHSRKPHRPRHHGRSHAHLLPALPLHPSHH